jgi:hydroxymethylpyrimidine pyrophosphatase-like HAD family hydrolase
MHGLDEKHSPNSLHLPGALWGRGSEGPLSYKCNLTRPLYMQIDLIALDLDGTLLDPKEEISPRNRAAIRRAVEAGIRVVLATGRGVDLPIRVSRELRLNLPVMENDLSVVLYAEEMFWRIEGTRIFMDDMTGPSWRAVASFNDVLAGGAPTFMRFLGAESVEKITARFGDLPLNFRRETWFEFVECAVLNRAASKRAALARLCADFQVSRETVLAIGDSRNDVPMLRWAGIGVAMGNASPEVKEAVRYVTASNREDGVALAIDRFVPAVRKKLA